MGKEKEKDMEVGKRVGLYDGYGGDPIWKQPENHSTYYNYEVDKQCRIPLPSREELLKELRAAKS